MQPVTTTPAPTPLPRHWARLIANEVVSELRRSGWRTHKTSRAWNPTGNPRSSYGSAAPVTRSKLLMNTETFETIKFTRGTVDPVPPLGVPPLVWTVTMDCLAALEEAQIVAFGVLCNRHRRDSPFHTRRNRHGNLTTTTSASCSHEEREAALLVAGAASVRVVDEVDYWDALSSDFDAELTISLLEGNADV